MKAISRALLAFAVVALATLHIASPAAAADDPIPVQSTCNQGWYVNSDEGALLPTQTEDGFLFDGPSLVHHVTDVPLADLTPGTFVGDLQLGVLPLFKVETTNPYSTLNYVGDGTTDLWWSSKIDPSQSGGQNSPIAAADLISLTLTNGKMYTTDTVVASFGVGYANDAGNKAVVSSITFRGTTYDLTCKTRATVTATSAATTPAATSPAPAVVPTSIAAAPALADTGNNLTALILVAVALVAAGVVVLVAARRRAQP